MDASDAKRVTRSAGGTQDGKSSSAQAPSGQKSKEDDRSTDAEKRNLKKLTSQEDEMYPVMLDSNRPREEWNISHVKPDSQRLIDDKPVEDLKDKKIVTTHEEDFKALNNVLRDNLMTDTSDAEIVFPGNGQRNQNNGGAFLADENMIQEIGSE